LSWFIGFLISTIMAILAYWKNSLSKSGVVGAIIVGTLILGGLGWSGFLVLTFFFVTSSGISKWSKRKKYSENNRTYHPGVEKGIVVKGDQRDIYQVLANGGVASLGALLYAWTNNPMWIFVFISSLAAATSDTWASEIGRWSRTAPRDVFTWKKTEPGTSGAISGLGTWASFFGAFLATLAAIPLMIIEQISINMFAALIIAAFSGWLGNWADTWVGAKWQVRYQCSSCQQKTEQRTHCRQPTKQVQGIYWLDNDVVNLICTLIAGVLSGFVYVLMPMS
jgi:uncharacterized protein (TIGR00297 family)